MKIKTTTQRTETLEIEINLPTFTKVVDKHSTKLYCIKSEKDITRVEQYNSCGITNVSKYSSISDAFTEGFEYVSQDEFMQYYLDTIDKLYADLSVLKAMLPKVTEDVEEEKEEEQGFEYDPETETMN
jgi:hypothetical protein